MDGITRGRGRRRRHGQQLGRRRVRGQVLAGRVAHADLDPLVPAPGRGAGAGAAGCRRGAVAAVAVGRAVGVAR